MGIFLFVRDLLLFPFQPNKKENRFWQFLRMSFKEYPAFLRIKPSFKKILVFPFLVIYYLFKRK